MTSPKKLARTTGLLILIMAVVGPFSLMIIPSQLVVPGDAGATAGNILESESLFQLGIIGHMIILFADIGVAILLFVLLKPVSKTLSLVAASFRLIMVAIRGFNLINYFIVLLLVNKADYLTVFDPNQLNALAMTFLNAFDSGILLDLIFFSGHLFFLGYLVFKSTYIPKILGILLIVASFGYLINSLTGLFWIEYKVFVNQIVTLPNAIAELALMFWFLIKGVNVPAWEKQLGASIGLNK
jgi:hypothetical protein